MTSVGMFDGLYTGLTSEDEILMKTFFLHSAVFTTLSLVLFKIIYNISKILKRFAPIFYFNF